MSQLIRVRSFKSIQNGQAPTYQKHPQTNKPHYFVFSNDRNRINSEMTNYQSLNSSSIAKTKEIMRSNFLNETSCKKYFYATNTPDKRCSLLNSQQKSQFNQINSCLKEKINASQSNKKSGMFTQVKNCKPPTIKKQLSAKLKTQPGKSEQKQYYQSTYHNIALNRLRNSVKHIKTLQQQKQNNQQKFIQQRSKSRSRSRSKSGKKGFLCTLYEKSQQKKINQSIIKSNNKLITVKMNHEKTQKDQNVDRNVHQSDLRRILLKKKSKDGPGNLTCFNSIVLERSRKKDISRNKSKSNQDSQLLKTVKKSSPVNRNSSVKKNSSLNKSVTNKLQATISSAKKLSPPLLQPWSQSKMHQSSNTKPTTKKITLNQRIQSNLNKIHQKYKFVLNYMSDFDIISRLNGYQLRGQQECKWVLLLIDQVYEMIKNSQKTKLKGFDYTRNYQYKFSGNGEEKLQ